MAKLFASEVAMEIALNAVRIHGGYGYSTEYDVERYFRDAPLMIVGEGTNEIQRNVIAGPACCPRGHLSREARAGVSGCCSRPVARRDRGRRVPRRRAAAHRIGIGAAARRQPADGAPRVPGPGGRGRGVPGAGPRDLRGRIGPALPATARLDRGPDEPVGGHHHGGAVPGCADAWTSTPPAGCGSTTTSSTPWCSAGCMTASRSC